MTVLEVMERVGTRDTKLTLAWIKDAVNLMQSNTKENLKVKKQALTKNTRDYDLPADVVAVESISILDTEDDGKYKRIRRLAFPTIVSEDTNP
tara:strand:+ start:300 stop:578 length:279 start_codon:yes stop_codon:yes gene_type:complete